MCCFGCNGKSCKDCVDYSNYDGVYGKRIHMEDSEIEQTCNDCDYFWDCYPNGKFNLDEAKGCYNILFDCVTEEN